MNGNIGGERYYSTNSVGKVVTIGLQYAAAFDFHTLRIRWTYVNTYHRPTGFSVYACTNIANPQSLCPFPSDPNTVSFSPPGSGWTKIGTVNTFQKWTGGDSIGVGGGPKLNYDKLVGNPANIVSTNRILLAFESGATANRFYLDEVEILAWRPKTDDSSVISSYNYDRHKATVSDLGKLQYIPDVRAAGGAHDPSSFFTAGVTTGSLAIKWWMPDFEVQSSFLMVMNAKQPSFDSNWLKFAAQDSASGGLSYFAIEHGLGMVPLGGVRVRLRTTNAAVANSGFEFEGVGIAMVGERLGSLEQSCTIKGEGAYGGAVFGYTDKLVHVWAPVSTNGYAIKTVGWGTIASSKDSVTADIRVQAEIYRPADYDSGWLKVDLENPYLKVDHGLLDAQGGHVRVMTRATSARNQYTFLFNGCPRGDLARTNAYKGNLGFVACSESCDADTNCNAIEVNGCLADPLNCGSGCYHFYGSSPLGSTGIYNGNCNTSGDQKAYLKVRGDELLKVNFDAVGSMHANEKYGCDYGGVIFGYSRTSVHVWTPSPFDSFNLHLASKGYFGASRPSGSFNIDGGALAIKITGNYWATVAIGSYKITEKSLLRFLFKETLQCEVSAVGLVSQTIDSTVEKFVRISGYDQGEWAFCSSGGAVGGSCQCNGKVRYGNDKFWSNPVNVAAVINCNDATFPGFASVENRHCECLITSLWPSAPVYKVGGEWQRYKLLLPDYYPVGKVYSHLVLVSDCDGTSLASGVSDISFSNILLTGSCGNPVSCVREGRGHIMNLPRGWGDASSPHQQKNEGEVRVMAWEAETLPAFDSGWFALQAYKRSSSDIYHNMGFSPGRVKVMYRADPSNCLGSLCADDITFEGHGSAQADLVLSP